MTQRYNLTKIGELLQRGFSDQELRDFCFYTDAFRHTVHEALPEGAGKKAEIVRLILDYAARQQLLETMLAWAKETNPAQFAAYEQALTADPGVALAPDTIEAELAKLPAGVGGSGTIEAAPRRERRIQAESISVGPSGCSVKGVLVSLTPFIIVGLVGYYFYLDFEMTATQSSVEATTSARATQEMIAAITTGTAQANMAAATGTREANMAATGTAQAKNMAAGMAEANMAATGTAQAIVAVGLEGTIETNTTPTPSPTPFSSSPTPTVTPSLTPPPDLTPAPLPTATPTTPPPQLELIAASAFGYPTAINFEEGRPVSEGLLGVPVEFEWFWDGALPPNQGFEIRVWQADEPQLGVHDAVLDNQQGRVEQVDENRYRLTVDITDAPGVRGRPGLYLWTVLLVQISPEYRELGIEARPNLLRLGTGEYYVGNEIQHNEDGVTRESASP